MSVPIIPALLRQNLADLAADGQRLDGRDKFSGRDIEIEIDCLANAEGSCRVRMGDTIVLAGVKFQIMTPYPDRHLQSVTMEICLMLLLLQPSQHYGPQRFLQSDSTSVRTTNWVYQVHRLCVLTRRLVVDLYTMQPREKNWVEMNESTSHLVMKDMFILSRRV